MSLHESPFESLPNELLDVIISNLSTASPSSLGLHQPPSVRIVKSKTRDLKNLARTSSRFLEVVQPRLFSHACFDLKDEDAFLHFISRWDLGRYVTSIVVKGSDPPDGREDPSWWCRALDCLDPLRITVVASPSFIGEMLGTKIMNAHSWAFQLPLQVLQLERDDKRGAPPPSTSQVKPPSSLLSVRPWSSLVFNESSSLKAYNHYEYFLFKVPSIFNNWGSLAPIRSHPEGLPLSLSLNKLTMFRYTAVFPFYNHVQLVLDAVTLMTNLRSLSIQLAPCPNDKATEIEQKGSMDPSDPWMELATGYSLIAHVVRDLGNRGCLVEFCACDYEVDALRFELSTILGDVLNGSEWTHAGHGTWIRKARCSELDNAP